MILNYCVTEITEKNSFFGPSLCSLWQNHCRICWWTGRTGRGRRNVDMPGTPFRTRPTSGPVTACNKSVHVMKQIISRHEIQPFFTNKPCQRTERAGRGRQNMDMLGTDPSTEPTPQWTCSEPTPQRPLNGSGAQQILSRLEMSLFTNKPTPNFGCT